MKWSFWIFLFLGYCLSIWLYGCLQGTELSSGKYLIIAPLPKAIEIRAHNDSLEKKIKVAGKKVADQKNNLSKVQEAFKKEDNKIKHSN